MTLDPFGNLMMSQTLFLDVDSIFFHDIILKKKNFLYSWLVKQI